MGRAYVLAAGALLTGCYTGLPDPGDTLVAGASDSDGPSQDDPEQPEVEQEHVIGDDLDTLDSEGFCRTLGPSQEVVGVGADGSLWLTETTSQGVAFEVIEPSTEQATAAPDALELGAVAAVQPRSAQEAVVVSAQSLWHVEGWQRIELVPPTAFDGAASVCGNPRHNGFVLAGGTMSEHRSDGWWGLTPDAEGDSIPTEVITVDGECYGPTDETWMTATDGTVWRVTTDGHVRSEPFSGLAGAAATGSTLAVIADGALWIGPDGWTRYAFAAGSATMLAASDEQVWIGIGSRVLRAMDDQFVELSHGLTTDVEAMWSHPGGVWLLGEGQLCHAGVGPHIEIDGVHPYLRTPDTELPVSLSSEPGVTLSATLDDQPLSLLPAEGAMQGLVVLEGLGWHRLEVIGEQADGTTDGNGTGRRTLWLRHEVPEVVSFERDVEPIALAHCSGSACHGATTELMVPVLETFGAWTSHAETIEERVVALDNMPPLGARSEDWGNEEVETIARWIEGGMLP
ncbi:MAG: hypothetical protein AB1Z98_32180 [Nannocystaceae bacterium]